MSSSGPPPGLAFSLAAIATVVIVVLWVFPGFLVVRPDCPSKVVQGDLSYCSESVAVPPPVFSPSQPCGNSSGGALACGPPTTVDFRSFSFTMRSNGYGRGSFGITGWMIEPNGTNYTLFSPSGSTFGFGWVNWASPDDVGITDWKIFNTVNSTLVSNWNVTLGVATGYPGG